MKKERRGRGGAYYSGGGGGGLNRGFTVSGKTLFAQSKCFPPEHNLLVREKHSLEQAAFWHEVKVVCCPPTPLFTYEGRLFSVVLLGSPFW